MTDKRIQVPNPLPGEECRQLAVVISDLQSVIDIIIKDSHVLIPGEAIDDLMKVWGGPPHEDTTLSGGSFIDTKIEELLKKLVLEFKNPSLDKSIIPALTDAGLTGDIGRLKRLTICRLKDLFLMFWHSEPRTVEKIGKAATALIDYFELLATIVSSIPGYEMIVEFISLLKQLIGLRAQRGF